MGEDNIHLKSEGTKYLINYLNDDKDLPEGLISSFNNISNFPSYRLAEEFWNIGERELEKEKLLTPLRNNPLCLIFGYNTGIIYSISGKEEGYLLQYKKGRFNLSSGFEEDYMGMFVLKNIFSPGFEDISIVYRENIFGISSGRIKSIVKGRLGDNVEKIVFE